MNWVVFYKIRTLVVQVFFNVLIRNAFQLQCEFNAAAERAYPCAVQLHFFRHCKTIKSTTSWFMRFARNDFVLLCYAMNRGRPFIYRFSFIKLIEKQANSFLIDELDAANK